MAKKIILHTRSQKIVTNSSTENQRDDLFLGLLVYKESLVNRMLVLIIFLATIIYYVFANGSLIKKNDTSFTTGLILITMVLVMIFYGYCTLKQLHKLNSIFKYALNNSSTNNIHQLMDDDSATLIFIMSFVVLIAFTIILVSIFKILFL